MTPHDIDAALERVPAGISALGGDLDDDEDRAVAVDWLWKLYREAVGEVEDVPQWPRCVLCREPIPEGMIRIDITTIDDESEVYRHQECPHDEAVYGGFRWEMNP